MLRLHMTLNMLDCLDDILDVVAELPPSYLRGIDKKHIIMLMEIVQDKKTDIDKQLLIEKRKEHHGRRHDETM